MSKKFKFNSNKYKEKMKFNEKSVLSTERISGAHIEMFSNKEIIVDGCHSIYNFNESCIHLNLVKNSVIIYGSCLWVSSFEEKVIIINGNISSVEFCEKGV